MADDNATAPAGATQPTPSFTLVGQYIRDMSFENPGAPNSMLGGGAGGPANLNISVGVKKQADEIYAVEITLTAKAEREKTVLFNVELVYGGVFRVKNVPEQQLPLLLMVEGPRLIFPFARQVLANITQQGGFAPLMIEPVDFMRLYQQNLAQLAAANKDAGGSEGKPN
ncbi:MAG TPA: protein-export chaperone SecB [Devosia sp.]